MSGDRIKLDVPFDKKSHVKMATKQIKATKQRYEQKLEVTNTKADSLNEMIRLGQNSNSALFNLSLPVGGPFDVKAPDITTTDTGLGGDYFQTKIKNTAAQREYNVAVKSVVKTSKAVFGEVGGAGLELADAQLGGTLEIKMTPVNGAVTQLDIDVYDGDSLQDIVDAINTELVGGHHNYEAFIVQDSASKDNQGNNTRGYIEIRAEEGETSSVRVSWLSGMMSAANLEEKSHQDFTQAKITIDGVELTSDTNDFVEAMPGIDVSVTKANHGNESQTMKIVGDPKTFGTAMDKVLNSINALSAFVQSQDPNNPTEDGEDPPLAGSMEIRAAKTTLDNFFGSYGESKLKEIGLSARLSTDKDHPSGTKIIELTDENKLKEALRDMKTLKKIFVNTAEVKSQGATVSKLHYTLSTEKISMSMDGKEFDIKVTTDPLGGDAHVVTATVDGKVITGEVKKGSVTFDKASILNGMHFHFNVNGAAANTDQTYKVTYDSGLLSNAYIDAQKVIDDQGNGLAKHSLDKVMKDKTSQKKRVDEADSKIDEIKEKYSRMDMVMKMRLQMAETMINALQDLF